MRSASRGRDTLSWRIARALPPHLANDMTTRDQNAMRALRLLKPFFDARSHRLPANEAIRAATAMGYTPPELRDLYTGTTRALQVDGDWWILTPIALQWYEEQTSLLMSRTE